MASGRFRRLMRVLPAALTLHRDVREEFAFHLDTRVDALVRAGVAPDAARAQAVREFGDVSAATDELTQLRRGLAGRRDRAAWWRDLGGDVRFAVRSLARRPGFAGAVLATLALGIGAAVAIFTVINAALIRPLPYRQPERLVHLWEVAVPGGRARPDVSYADFTDWRAQASGFAGLEGYDETNLTVAGPDGAVMLRGARVTAGFFQLLGVAPRLGRAFATGDDGPGDADVVIVGDHYWRHVLGADATVLGRTIAIDHRPRVVVGVLPPGFRFAPAGDAELWLPVDRDAAARQGRDTRRLRVIGRLGAGVMAVGAERELAAVMGRRTLVDPASGPRAVRLVSLRDQVAGDLRPVLWALLTAVGVLLLIACANVAGLVLARALSRSRELGVRAAIGASHGRLVRQLLAEGAVLAAGGAAIGYPLACLGVGALVRAAPAGVLDQMAYLRDARPDGTVLMFTVALALATGAVCGLTPVWLALRSGLAPLLAAGGRSTGTVARARAHDGLVTVQLALTTVLLVGAALVGRSLLRLVNEDPGFVPGHVLTARVPLAGPAYAPADAQQRYFEQGMARLRDVPGVRDVGAVTSLPLNGASRVAYRVEGLPEPDSAARAVAVRRGVAGDYFAALGIPLVAGRLLDARDDSAAPRALVISRSLAEQVAPVAGPSPPASAAIGRRLRLDAFAEGPWEVVGVVGDVKTGALDAPPPPTVYYSHRQVAENRLTFVIRVSGSPRAAVPAVRAALRAADPDLPVYQVAAMDDVVSGAWPAQLRRYALLLIGGFGTTALLLALVGVYGVVALTVNQRTRELAIRAALGATPRGLLVLVLRRAVQLVGAAAVAGTLLAGASGRFLAALLYGTTTTDPLVYLGVVLLIGVAALGASAVPARRAARANPADVLRAD